MARKVHPAHLAQQQVAADGVAVLGQREAGAPQQLGEPRIDLECMNVCGGGG
jgi:hypothetical protein